jgi:ferritin
MISTNRLSKTIEAALNSQMTKEAHAAQIYLSYGAWSQSEGYGGIANFLFKHSQEERTHMSKIVDYILKRGGNVNITAIPKPNESPLNITNCFEHIFEHEVENTEGIYRLANLCLDEEDWATWNFIQWFVNEQIEEETLAINILDKMKIARGDKTLGNTIYSIDKDLNSASKKDDQLESVNNVTNA